MFGIKRLVKKILAGMYKQVKVEIPLYSGQILNGKTIMVTGGGSGIGIAIARACVENGGNVIILGRSIERLKSAKINIKKETGKDVETFVMDISDVDSIKEVFSLITFQTENPRIDILINNAGIQEGASFPNTEVDKFNQTINTNIRGTYFLSQVFADYLISNRISGNILNVCSVSGNRPANSPYMLSKWSEIGMTKGLAKTLIKYNIVVNGVAPGPTASGMLEKKANGDLTLPTSPAGRYVTPEEIANLVLYLISDMGRMIVGEVVYITGGAGRLTFDDIMY